ncbi:restriction endonuclease, partial [Candidatus Woesearchaeota archaeon]
NLVFDFAILTASKSLVLLETNFYSTGGSKLNSTAEQYKYRNDQLKKEGIKFVWITDGPGWLTAKASLLEVFKHNDFLLNLDFVKKGVLSDILSI